MLLIGGMESKGKIIRSEILEYGFESGVSNVEILMNTNRVGCTALCHRKTLVLRTNLKETAFHDEGKVLSCCSYCKKREF